MSETVITIIILAVCVLAYAISIYRILKHEDKSEMVGNSLKKHWRAWVVWLGVNALIVVSMAGTGEGVLMLLGVITIPWALVILALERPDDDVREEAHVQSIRRYEMPDDAHDAVAAFSRLAKMTYDRLEQMSPGRDKYFYMISINLTYGRDNRNASAKFTFDYDWAMVDFHRYMRIQLENRFTVDGDCVTFESKEIEGLDTWVGQIYRRCKELNSSVDIAIEPIVLTVTNNCPEAYVTVKAADDTGFFLSFKFR